MNLSVKGQRVVITAGASGIGRAIAETMTAAGARAHVCDVDQAALDAAKKALPGLGTTRPTWPSPPTWTACSPTLRSIWAGSTP